MTTKQTSESPEKSLPDNLRRERALEEGQKLYFDAMKHLTTLSTGSILILVTFLQKVFYSPKWRILVALAFLSFIGSIVFSFSRMIHAAHDVGNLGHVSEDLLNVSESSYLLAIVCFLVGLICLIVFVSRNLI